VAYRPRPARPLQLVRADDRRGSVADFCGIASGAAKAEVVFESRGAVAFLDRHPAARGHVMVVPLRPGPCDAGGRARPSRRPRDLGAPRRRGVRAPRRIPAAGAREDAPPPGGPRAARDVPRDRSAHGRGLPAFVERDLRAYLACGILAHGFARVRCPDCGFERLVAFSCKAAVCPSCAARRMEDGAEHLVRNVLPQVPVRQWVLSFPRRVRFLAARHPALASRLLDVFTRAVFAWQRRTARRLGGGRPASGSTATIVTGARGSAATSCDRRSRCSGSRRARRAGSSTG